MWARWVGRLSSQPEFPVHFLIPFNDVSGRLICRSSTPSKWANFWNRTIVPRDERKIKTSFGKNFLYLIFYLLETFSYHRIDSVFHSQLFRFVLWTLSNSKDFLHFLPSFRINCIIQRKFIWMIRVKNTPFPRKIDEM